MERDSKRGKKRSISQAQLIPVEPVEDSDDSLDTVPSSQSPDAQDVDESFNRVTYFKQSTKDWLEEVANDLLADIVFDYLDQKTSGKKDPTLVIPLNKTVKPETKAIKAHEYKHDQRNLVKPLVIGGDDNEKAIVSTPFKAPRKKLLDDLLSCTTSK